MYGFEYVPSEDDDEEDEEPAGPETLFGLIQEAFLTGSRKLVPQTEYAYRMYSAMNSPVSSIFDELDDQHPFWQMPADTREAQIWLALSGSDHRGQYLTANSREPSVGSIVLERMPDGTARALKRDSKKWRSARSSYTWEELVIRNHDYRLIYSPEGWLDKR